MKVKINGNQCRECKETHEHCGDKKKCPNWRVSYEVCIVFGTRPSKPEFTGTCVSR